MKEYKGAKRSELGQATMEYILILLIVLIIALGALYQLNTAFANFAENYFGNYLACLLETGELPNLGASQGTTCDSEYEEFSLENGRRKRLEVRTTAKSGVTPSQSEETAGEEEEEEDEVGGGGRGGGGRGGRGGRRYRSKGPSRLSTAAAPGESEKGSNSKRSIKSPSEGGSDSISRGRAFSSSKSGPKKISSNFEVTRKKTETKLKTTQASIGDERQGRDRKLAVKRVRKKTVLDEDDEPFTFGQFIRYLLIAGIIIAIVIFLGGQILQFSQGDDG